MQFFVRRNLYLSFSPFFFSPRTNKVKLYLKSFTKNNKVSNNKGITREKMVEW